MVHDVRFLPNRRDYFNVEFGTVYEDLDGGGGSGGSSTADEYPGPYTVIPQAENDQVLQTKDYLMIDDVTVKEIPCAVVSNLAGGETISIAS